MPLWIYGVRVRGRARCICYLKLLKMVSNTRCDIILYSGASCKPPPRPPPCYLARTHDHAPLQCTRACVGSTYSPTHLGSPPTRDYHHCLVAGGWVWVGGVWVGGRGVQGVSAVVSRGSRVSGVTIGTPPMGSTPTHPGSPPPRDYHHCLLSGCGGWVWVCGLGGGGGGYRGSPRW